MTGGADSGRTPISAERWLKLEPLVDAALELSVEERRAYCASVAATDPELGADLERLIRHSDTRHSLLAAAALDRFALLFEDDSKPNDASLRDSLQASLGATYTLDRELVGGGMSRVFVAHEPSLGREVVIKLLTPGLSNDISAERFAREIKLAASLQQANIVPLLAAGTAAGLSYYTMPFVDGRSLRERLARDGALPIGDAVSILRDIARALAFAHARGVVHRDIKPGNVLLSGGTAVVTDFGIAKAIGAARGEGRADDLTGEGMSLGTPAYMAPEQAVGDPATDHRADIYSFGCLAFEVLTGNPPFHGATLHGTIAGHLNEIPKPVTAHRPDAPPAVAELVARCLEKKPERRPQSAGELLEALDGLRAASSRPSWWGRKQALAIVATTAVVGVIAAVAYAKHPSSPKTLTVSAIPFSNVTRDTALAYRSDGVADEILTGLARVPGVQIMGRAAARRYADRPGVVAPDLRAVARELGVRFIITGTFRERDGRTTVFVQLNDSASSAELWSQAFTRDSKEFGSITDEVVRSVADTLRARFPRLVGRQGASTAGVGTTNDAAYDLYLYGQDLFKRRGSGVEQSITMFEQAIALDPGYARAHAALATALQLLPYFIGTPPSEVRDRTLQSARRALELDSTLADAHVAMGSVYAAEGGWSASDAEFERAVALEPSNVGARQTYARFLILRGESARGLEQLVAARKIERVSPLLSAWTGYALLTLGRRDSAFAEIALAIQLDSTLLPAANHWALMNLARGNAEAARRLIGIPVPVGVMTYAPYVYAKLGNTAQARRLVDVWEEAPRRPWFTDVARASISLAVGDSDSALALLERSQKASSAAWVQYLPISSPAYDLIRKSRRFADLLREAHLDVDLIQSYTSGSR